MPNQSGSQIAGGNAFGSQKQTARTNPFNTRLPYSGTHLLFTCDEFYTVRYALGCNAIKEAAAWLCFRPSLIPAVVASLADENQVISNSSCLVLSYVAHIKSSGSKEMLWRSLARFLESPSMRKMETEDPKRFDGLLGIIERIIDISMNGKQDIDPV